MTSHSNTTTTQEWSYIGIGLHFDQEDHPLGVFLNSQDSVHLLFCLQPIKWGDVPGGTNWKAGVTAGPELWSGDKHGGKLEAG